MSRVSPKRRVVIHHEVRLTRPQEAALHRLWDAGATPGCDRFLGLDLRLAKALETANLVTNDYRTLRSGRKQYNSSQLNHMGALVLDQIRRADA
jgi:hypothetical protein